MGVLLRNFHGSCILFAQLLDWRPAIIWPWTETACDFILYLNIAVNIFYATFMGFATLLIAYKCDKKYAKKIGKMNDWHIAYVLGALNPVFLIVNILITSLELCSASVVAAGTQEFCVNLLKFLSVTARSSPMPSTTTTPLPSSTGSMAPCNIVHSVFDADSNSTVMYTLDMCTTSTTPFTTTTLMAHAAQSCSEVQSWDVWWQNMRIVRGRTRGLNGSNFYGCLILVCIASFLVLAVWIVQLALNVGMMMRVCTCDVAEEKRKDDRKMVIAQRRSRLATPSVTPGGGVGRHTPQLFPAAPQQPLGPGEPPQGPPRQYGLPPPARDDGGTRTPEMPPEKKVPPSDSDVDTSGAPPQQYVLPPPQRRMEPSPRRPVDEGPVVVEPAAAPPPAYHQLPPPQVRSPPSKLV